ncbi:helix-hairpin-helix domain-containing protein [Hymenobacter weizhouensis]|uniref:helix-hairpin-helix domain-containing protein n=1 Tax=Hymenobacter sp. YIM 151500-1 TaxID=2987689 RepID=UPI0022279FAB|nr:helix-hairpin-helix domain-containing protein [Hymenobacter sp. YIM 151500-1]UYZ65250.1 helix-hairpin-helix domain-containing protein [Hymenobacter sp. YIM 151500-1]
MDNRALIRAFRLAAQLMELHEENPFKIRAYEGTATALEQLSFPVAEVERTGLPDRTGLSKTAAAKVAEMLDTGSFDELNRLLSITPPGVVELLKVKGIGPKKIRALWKELGIESAEQLRQAAQNDEVSKLKGFGKKTQDAILAALEFTDQSRGKLLYPQAEALADDLVARLRQALGTEQVAVAGEVRRRLETVETIRLVAATEQPAAAHAVLSSLDGLTADPRRSGPWAWRGTATASGAKVEVLLVPPAEFTNELFLQSAAEEHLSEALADETRPGQPATLRRLLHGQQFASEQDIYQRAGLQYVEPELREGLGELALARDNKLPRLLEVEDLRGSLHNHSTYSDGNHSLRDMATFLRDRGYEYLGICDHSQAAHYANGLSPERVRQQQREIDELNQELAPFRIFKGIESDILGDGALDYPPAVLETFDFVVASVHSNLKMDERKATARVLRAVENPYTTMLGHPTGRLLLRREGYPLDHKAIIDACARHQVIIEINANPWRLDLDWRWVRYALDQGVPLSINPDAHHTDGYADMRYGVLMGRKGGLTKDMTFNAKSVEEVAAYFAERKARIKPPLAFQDSLFG